MAGVMQAEPPKSTPDIAKLSGMTTRVVQVTRHTTKNGPGQLVVPAWKGVSVDQVNELMSMLPRQYGPGTYKFEVYDEGGPEKDVWTVRLGPETPEANAGGSMGAPNFMSQMPSMMGAPGGDAGGTSGAALNPIGGMSIELAPGWFYVPSMGAVITPQKQMIPWRMDQGGAPPWGGPAASSPIPGLSMPGMTGLPGAMPGMPMLPPWGSIPATGGVDESAKREAEALREQVRKMEEALRESERRREAEAREQTFRSAIEEQRKQTEAVLARLTENKGPSPEIVALQAQLEETKRQAAEAVRRSEEERRDAEARRREDALRAEIAAQAERTEKLIREITANRTDPMLPLFGQIISAQQQASAAVAEAMEKASSVQAEASKETSRLMADRLSGSVLTPDRTVELIRLAKDRGPEDQINKGMADMYKTVFGMAQDLIRAQAEINGAGAGPTWLPIAQQGVEQIGRLAQAFAVAKAQQQARPAPQRHSGADPRPRNGHRGGPHRQVTAAPASAAIAPPPLPAEKTPQQIRDEAAQHMFPTPSQNSSQAQRAAAAAALDQPAEVIPPPAPRRRGRPPKQQPTAPAQAPAAPMQETQQFEPTPEQMAAAQAGISPEQAHAQFAAAPESAVREVVNELSDEEFFGEALSQVDQLRQAVAEGSLPPDEAASAVLTARQYFASFGVMPPCIELMLAGHVGILVERLLPDVPDAYREAVAEVIMNQLQAEAQATQ